MVTLRRLARRFDLASATKASAIPAWSALAGWFGWFLALSACGSPTSTEDATRGGEAGSEGGIRGSGGAVTGGSSSGGIAAVATGGQAGGGGGGRAGAASLGGAAGAPNGKGGASGGGTAGAVTEPGAVDCRHDGDGKTTLVFVNHCAQALTFAGSDIQGGALGPGEHKCVDIGSATEALSSKRYWGFKGDDPGAEHHSLAEFTFNTDFNDFDWYNISYVDAFNLPMQLVPVARSNCKTLTCSDDFISACPEVGRYKNASGQIVACVSPNRNDGNSPVARYFEACDDAYAWSGDDQNGTDPSPVRACAGEDWDIVFCP
jgi:hypothetical protein